MLPTPFEITKEQLTEYPIKSFGGPIFLIDKEEQLSGLGNYFKNERILGIDTETRPAFKKGTSYKVALLQIATSKHVLLLRLNHMKLPLLISDIFEDKSIIKAGIGLTDDIRALHKIAGFHAEGFIDLNTVAQQKGFVSIGAKKLSALVLGFRISKRLQLSNWEAQELTDAQQLYAATDAWVAREIYLKLRKYKTKTQE